MTVPEFLKKSIDKYNIVPKGIIHIGSGDANEVHNYVKENFNPITLIDAHPGYGQHIKDKLESYSKDFDIKYFNIAITNYKGEADFYISNNRPDCSSLKVFTEISDYFPSVQYSRTITIPCTTLDLLFEENNLTFEDYNIMNIDIQGSEIDAFSEATKLLKYIDIINCEVNDIRLYENGALYSEVTEFLSKKGFQEVDFFRHHETFGDAIYIKKEIVDK